MPGVVSSHHFSDSEGRPCGGTTYGRGFAISWQNGSLGRGEGREEPNGAFVEDVIKAAIGRLHYYQQSPFACAENAAAFDHLCLALACLERRTREREARGVEGTHEV